jgi:pyruvate dehydrogenase E2 component (dihydrolipoamide acetyltransferase)
MAIVIEMPKLSDTMSEGVLHKWHKQEGERVAAGELLAEVETDKATMEWESFDEGVLLKRLVAEGATVPIGSPVGILGSSGEDISAVLATVGGDKPSAPVATAPARAEALAAPVAPAALATTTAVAANGQSGRGLAASASTNGRLKVSPLARRIAEERGLDLRTIQGSGPAGRIVRRDLEGRSASSTPTVVGVVRPVSPATPAPFGELVSGVDERPLTMMRKTIARRLLESKTTIPHFYLTSEADVDALAAFRDQLNQASELKISFNDLILKATALALRKVPEANAHWGGDKIVVHSSVHLGMAVSIEDGLITPVIRVADQKSLGAISREARELTERARGKKLKPEEFTGSTFSVSNLGMFGVRHFEAIINPPEAAILAVGAIRKEPLVRGDSVVVGRKLSLTLSCDHRVVDGAMGARLLRELVAHLERPASLAL